MTEIQCEHKTSDLLEYMERRSSSAPHHPKITNSADSHCTLIGPYSSTAKEKLKN